MNMLDDHFLSNIFIWLKLQKNQRVYNEVPLLFLMTSHPRVLLGRTNVTDFWCPSSLPLSLHTSLRIISFFLSFQTVLLWFYQTALRTS